MNANVEMRAFKVSIYDVVATFLPCCYVSDKKQCVIIKSYIVKLHYFIGYVIITVKRYAIMSM